MAALHATQDPQPVTGQTRAGVSVLERPGPGPAVLFLHGIGSNARSFVPLFSHLPGRLRLIAWNAPGYLGSSPLPQATPQAVDYAHAALRLLDALDLQHVHVVGHSLGTLVAAALARIAPERLSSLTLAAAANGYGRTAGAPLPPKAAERLADLDRLGPADFAKARAARLVHAPDDTPGTVALVEAEMARIIPAGYTQAVHMLASGNLTAAMAQVAMQPGFVIGAEDQVTPLAQTEAAARAWHAAHGAAPRIVTIPDAGHAVYLQAPQATARALTDLVPALRCDTQITAERSIS